MSQKTQAPKTEPKKTPAKPQAAAKPAAKPEVKATEKNVVKMVFQEHKYYNDLDTPMFLAGQVYELEGAAWIQRWMKRGGQIVEGTIELPTSELNPSVIVDNEPKGESTEVVPDGTKETEE